MKNEQLQKALAMWQSPDVRNKHLAVDIIESNKIESGMDALVDVVREWETTDFLKPHYAQYKQFWTAMWYLHFNVQNITVTYTIINTWDFPDLLIIDSSPMGLDLTNLNNLFFKRIQTPSNITSDQLRDILNDHSRAVILECFDFRNNRWRDTIWTTKTFPLFDFAKCAKK